MTLVYMKLKKKYFILFSWDKNLTKYATKNLNLSATKQIYMFLFIISPKVKKEKELEIGYEDNGIYKPN